MASVATKNIRIARGVEALVVERAVRPSHIPFWLKCLGLSFAASYGVALLIKRLSAVPRITPALEAISGAMASPAHRAIGEAIGILIALVVALWAPQAVLRRTERLRQAFAMLANRKREAILFAGLLPMVVRLGLLPVLGVPQPLIADEFGYLLIADTLASGRVANPAHPYWQHFETIYAFHQPVYASIYPVAPALPLMVTKFAGVSPWLGIWAAAGLMCALICWMLQGWVPPKWALAGALLAGCRFAIIGPWMNTYWGGAVAAIGGALLLGALPRIKKQTRVRDSLLFGLGLAVLSQSRPYEGFLLSVPVTIALGVWLVKARRPAVAVRARNVVLPLGTAMLLLLSGILYYNSQVTGNALTMPYGLHQKIYGTPQSFYWQEPIRDAPGIHRHPDIAQVFQWQREAYDAQLTWTSVGERLDLFWQFYLHPLFTVPLLLVPWVCRSWRVGVLLVAGVLVMAGNSLYPFFFPHYAAPLCGLLMLLIVQGMRRLRLVRWRGAPAGRAAVIGLLLLTAASASWSTLAGMMGPLNVTATYTPRGEVLRQLQPMSGKHLILVRYSSQHSFHYGVVYNDADIDNSPVVWARELDDSSNRRLIAYFYDRTVWRFNPDTTPATLVPLTLTKPFVTKVAAGTGRRDDPRDGISPGGIALLLGGNFAADVDGTTVTGLLGRAPFRLASVSAEYGNLLAPSRHTGPRSQDAGSAARQPARSEGGCRKEPSVHFGDFPARVLGVSNFDGQEAITVQAPAGLRPGQAVVTVRSCGGAGTTRVRVLPAAPGIFQAQMGESQIQAVVVRGDGSAVTADHPARRGEVLHLFATGLGPEAPKQSSLIVGVNHHGAGLVSVTPAAGLPGVFDIAFTAPDDVPSGPNIPLSVGILIDRKIVYSNKSSLPME